MNSAVPESKLTGLAGKRVIAVMFSNFPGDPRPRRAAEALQRAGADVEVICLRYSPDEPGRETFNGIRITRIPLKRKRGGKLGYLWQYGAFLLACTWLLAVRSLRRRYALVHVHNMPDFLVFSALVPKLTGARVILDQHDPMPELMITIFGLRPESRQVSLLKTIEKWSLRFANTVITVNEACRRIFSGRSCPASRIAVVMNSPDEEIFRYHPAEPGLPAAERTPEQPFVIMYHGSIVERHGLDLAVDALRRVRKDVPSAELHIYGRSTPFLETVLRNVRCSDISSAVHYHGPKTIEEITEAIRRCDVGVIPNRRSIFTWLNTPTRIFEYLSQGRPVIAPRAPGILDYFSEDELILFDLGDARDLADRIRFVYAEPEAACAITRRGQAVYRSRVWSQEKEHFLSVVRDTLEPAGRKPAPSQASPVLSSEPVPTAGRRR